MERGSGNRGKNLLPKEFATQSTLKPEQILMWPQNTTVMKLYIAWVSIDSYDSPAVFKSRTLSLAGGGRRRGGGSRCRVDRRFGRREKGAPRKKKRREGGNFAFVKGFPQWKDTIKRTPIEAHRLVMGVQGWAKKWCLGCVNSCPASRRSQVAGFTQPRSHLVADPCTVIINYFDPHCDK